MPLAGGAADKYGGRYEGLWTISRMADMIAERAESIYLEPPAKRVKGWSSGFSWTVCESAIR